MNASFTHQGLPAGSTRRMFLNIVEKLGKRDLGGVDKLAGPQAD